MALVTGGCTGIGLAVVRHLGAAGARVAVNHPHTPELAETVVSDLRADDIEAEAFAADVSDRSEFAGMVDAVIERWGRWDALVSNAAIATTMPLVEFDEAAIAKLFAVNVNGVV